MIYFILGIPFSNATLVRVRVIINLDIKMYASFLAFYSGDKFSKNFITIVK